MENYCLGFEKLMDGKDCSLCKAKELGNNKALAFYRYKDGYTKFDVVDTSHKLFFGKRVDQHMGFNTMNLIGLQEALTMIQESSLYKNLVKNWREDGVITKKPIFRKLDDRGIILIDLLDELKRCPEKSLEGLLQTHKDHLVYICATPERLRFESVGREYYQTGQQNN
jgi:hypothetical protein